MKKVLFATTLAIISVSIITISSCAKKEEEDFTKDIVGTFTGTLVDTTAGTVGQNTSAATILVSKVDNNRVKFTGASITTMDAGIQASNSAGTVFTFPTFSDAHGTWTGITQSRLGISGDGSYELTTHQLLWAIHNTDGDVITYTGTKQ